MHSVFLWRIAEIYSLTLKEFCCHGGGKHLTQLQKKNQVRLDPAWFSFPVYPYHKPLS